MTKNLKIGVSIVVVLVIAFFLNSKSQSQYASQSSKLFNVDANEIQRFLIQQGSDAIEISRSDSSWVISGNDTLVIKDQSIDNFLSSVLGCELSTMVSSNQDKWATYSVDDSTGTHLALIDTLGNTLQYAIFGRSKSDYSRNYVRTHSDPNVYLTNESIIYYLNTRETYWGEKPKEDPPAADSTAVE